MPIATDKSYIHKTVLKMETIESILPSEALIKSLAQLGQKKVFAVDATLGGGGHSQALVTLFQQAGLLEKFQLFLVAIDRDENAIKNTSVQLDLLKKQYQNFDFVIFNRNFSDLREIFEQNFSDAKINCFFADLGVSSPQLDHAERGFSLINDGPVDMRMDPNQSTTAKEILLTYSEAELSRIFFEYGQEHKARKLAKAIVQDRKIDRLPLESSRQLADYFKRVLAYPPNSKIHPATRAFQALRIEVNQELESLETILQDLPSLMSEFGKAAFISFHSLEDRLVKHAMRNWQKGKQARATDKKETDFSLPLHIQAYLEENRKVGFGRENPRGGIVPSAEECQNNSRSRSARLRCFEFGKIETNE